MSRSGDTDDFDDQLSSAASVLPRQEGAARFAELEALTRAPNWNDEDDEAIPESTWGSARAFLASASDLRLPEPIVSPCGDGSIHFSWTAPNGARVIVERKSGRTICRIRDPAGRRDNRESTDRDALELVRKLFV